MDAAFPVSSREAAVVLATPELARLLKPFMREARSCSEVARELHVPIGWLHYRLQKLAGAGLLEVVDRKKRSGKPILLYRAVSRRFVMDIHLLPAQKLEELQTSQLCKDEFSAAIRPYRFVPGGRIVVELLPGGALTWKPESGPIDLSERSEPVLDHHTSALFLSHADAQALREELLALIRRYEGRRGERRYGLVAGLVPLEWPVDG